MTVLVEKMNVNNVDKSGMKKKELGTVCNIGIQSAWKKDFTLEFSRDRKSMSCFCIPQKSTRLGPGPKMFVKVRCGALGGLVEVLSLGITTVHASALLYKAYLITVCSFRTRIWNSNVCEWWITFIDLNCVNIH